MESRKKALISRHIVLYKARHPLYGIILIEDEVIKEVIVVDKSIPVSALMNKYSEWDPINFEHYYISPGIIDCNVRTNGEWEPYRNLTRAALCGGVTMLLEEPSLFSLSTTDSELFCDIGRVFLCSNDSLFELETAISAGVFAVKAYLSPPTAYVGSVENVLPSLVDQLSRMHLPLFLDVSYPSQRHIYMGSPCRFQPIESRLTFHDSSDNQFFAGAFPDDEKESSDEEELPDTAGFEGPTRTLSEIGTYRPGRISGHFDVKQVPSPKHLTIEVIPEEPENTTRVTRGLTITSRKDHKRLNSLPKLGDIYQDLDKRIKKTEGNIADLANVEYSDYLQAGETVYEEPEAWRRRSSSFAPVSPIPSTPSEGSANVTPPLTPPSSEFKGRLQQIRPIALTIAKPDESKKTESNGKERSYMHHLANFPDRWERKGVELISDRLLNGHCRVHICNLSSANAVNKVRKLKCPWITCETCPHYLYFTSDQIKDGGTIFKTHPPIRNQSNNELLWDLLKMKGIDVISSNHTPIAPMYKFVEEGNFRKAANGINGLGFSLQAVWSRLRSQCTTDEQSEHYIVRLSKWLSLCPAKVLGISHLRGAIDKGRFADLIVWKPKEKYTVYNSPTQYPSMCPYLEEVLYGKIYRVYLRGSVAFDEGALLSKGRRLYKNQFT